MDAEFHDIRGQQNTLQDIYNPNDYSVSQAFAKGLRDKGSNGIAYSSVRDPDGECIAILRPSILSLVTQGPHYCYVWDGLSITAVYKKSKYRHN